MADALTVDELMEFIEEYARKQADIELAYQWGTSVSRLEKDAVSLKARIRVELERLLSSR